jgi:hypothetical protein
MEPGTLNTLTTSMLRCMIRVKDIFSPRIFAFAHTPG